MEKRVPQSPYEFVTYQGAVSPNTSPDHLSVCALSRGHKLSASQRVHFIELGCGDGANLLPLAFYHPESTFIGIDNARGELDRASECAKYLSLENIHFVLKDVRDLPPEKFPPCDYVIAHGLYSWVSDDARAAILAFCRQSMTPSGLAYISYNAQPGWATRGLVRETLRRAHSVREAAVEDQGERAIEVAARFLEDLQSRNDAFAVLLAKELERVRDGKPSYVFHEYLAEINEGFWLRDFVERARRSGLEYVADAQFCRSEGQVPVELRAVLAKRNLDPIEQEESVDLLCHRCFHASILCRADTPRESLSCRELLEEVHLATSLCPESDPLDLKEGVAERFCRTHGLEITLDTSITKAAVLSLAVQWPQGMRLEALYQQASKLLTEYGYEVPTGAQSLLSDELVTLFEAGQMDLRLREPAYAREIAKYPQAHVLARFEAERCKALTTPYHLLLPFEPQALTLVHALDGSRSQVELQQMFGADLVEQTLPILGRWGLLAERRVA